MFNSTRGGKNNSLHYNAERGSLGKYKPPQIKTSPIMRSSLHLEKTAMHSYRRQAVKATRPDHAAFHQTRHSLGAHSF